MRRRDFLVSAMMASVAVAARPFGLSGAKQEASRPKILIAGGNFGTAFIRYMAQLKPGYACDNNVGIYFEDNQVKRVVATREGARVYYVSVVGGTVVEKVFEPEIISSRQPRRKAPCHSVILPL